jgi:hypothetical protein
MTQTPLRSTADLLASEKRLLATMHGMQFGRFENVPIKDGELILDPWPRTVRAVKFGPEPTTRTYEASGDFELQRSIVELFEYVRAVDAGEISRLEIRFSVPVSMEIVCRPDASGGRCA